MADEELQIEEGGKKSKMMLIIIIAVVLLGGGAAAYFFLFTGDDTPPAEQVATGDDTAPAPVAKTKSELGTALYVAMPRPFVFNVPGNGRDRLVEIKVQLMVRGVDNEEAAKKHIPLIEGTLLQVFSAGTADDLITEAGKVTLREQALTEVQRVMKEITDGNVVEQVLFTGFVMQ
ncbi:flagellar basal body-associated protein FliL [Alteromonas pelagimontana]|uniref:Flagellar protein FliL n=1 Tax=Alteromonas pelagimontana TaxID=1858656 RepID=A0A6M4MFB5_9ALTE|nr:flagellar basal body-associated protein FliL [Alteromonas pelagimontana]QJR81861.1 flagellar basal body-associated protein FliL [Alteromonas pelagimontana]